MLKEAKSCRPQSMRESLLGKLLALAERSGNNLYVSRIIAEELYGPQAKADEPERKKPDGLFQEMFYFMGSIQENLNKTADIINRLKDDVMDHRIQETKRIEGGKY